MRKEERILGSSITPHPVHRHPLTASRASGALHFFIGRLSGKRWAVDGMRVMSEAMVDERTAKGKEKEKGINRPLSHPPSRPRIFLSSTCSFPSILVLSLRRSFLSLSSLRSTARNRKRIGWKEWGA